MIRNWKKEILTIPNLLSLFRMTLIPVYVRIYQTAATRWEYLLAGAVISLSCLTDLADGMIARRWHMVSSVGKILDPAADKLTQLSLILCLAGRHPMLYPLLGLFLIKEIFQICAVVDNFRQGKALPGALPAGKVCTTVLFLSLIVLVLFPELDRNAAEILISADVGFLLYSFGWYIRAYYGKNKLVQDLE